MEEILGILVQALVEFLLEFLAYVGFDLAWKRKDGGVGCGFVLFFVLVGGALGALANWMTPRVLLPLPWMRVVNLIVAPIAAGLLSFAIARWRRKRGAALDPADHFATAFAFVLGFNVVRFAFAAR